MSCQTAAEELMGRAYQEKYFAAHFGVPLAVMDLCWNAIRGCHARLQPKHLCWTLYFLKTNPGNRVCAIPADVKTWTKWVPRVIGYLLERLPQVHASHYTNH
jgi:hypothetical protein